MYYKSEVLECICECFPPGDGTYGSNAYLDLDKQLPFRTIIHGQQEQKQARNVTDLTISFLTFRKPMQKQMGWKAVL